jgi:hypothetical protein
MPKKTTRLEAATAPAKDAIVWSVPEYDRPTRDKRWYIIASIVALVLIGYAIYDRNYIFAMIILIGAVLLMVFDRHEAQLLEMKIDGTGIHIGSSFYEFDELKDFFIVYRPQENVRNLYFHFKSAIRQRLSIPLLQSDPIAVRDFLRRFLPEDLDKTNQPLSESLTKLLKL